MVIAHFGTIVMFSMMFAMLLRLLLLLVPQGVALLNDGRRLFGFGRWQVAWNVYCSPSIHRLVFVVVFADLEEDLIGLGSCTAGGGSKSLTSCLMGRSFSFSGLFSTNSSFFTASMVDSIISYRSSFFSFKWTTDFCVGDSGTSRVGELFGEKPWLCVGERCAGLTIFKWFKLTSRDGLLLCDEPLLKAPSSIENSDGLLLACRPFTVMIHGSSMSLSGFDSSLELEVLMDRPRCALRN